MTMSDTRRRSLGEIFAIPLALGLISGIGLVAALIGDGPLDWLSWASLGAPVVVTAWCLARAR